MKIGNMVICNDGERAKVTRVQRFGLGPLSATAVTVERRDGVVCTYPASDLVAVLHPVPRLRLVVDNGRVPA